MKPLVLGHRGANAYAPENTLAGFLLALEMGADGVELDVTLTKDGIPVVIHDDTVDRTTDGHGPIRQMTLDEAKRLDAGLHFPSHRGERIPTLAEVLEAVGTRGLVNIELKGLSPAGYGLEPAVLQVIERTKASGRVMLSSFNPISLFRMRRLAPSLPRGLLYGTWLPIYLRRAWLRPIARPTSLNPAHAMVTPRFVRWARAKNYAINTWTVDEEDEIKRLVGLGVNAIISNKPDVLRRIVDASV